MNIKNGKVHKGRPGAKEYSHCGELMDPNKYSLLASGTDLDKEGLDECGKCFRVRVLTDFVSTQDLE